MCNAVSKLFKEFKSDEFYKNYIIEGLVQTSTVNLKQYIEKKINNTVQTLTQVDWLSKLRYKK